MNSRKSKPITKELVVLIKADLAKGNLIQSKIAAKYDINQGRVSEVKHGKWDHL